MEAEIDDRPFVPDLGDTSVDEMRALKTWHEEQADKMGLAARKHKERANHLGSAISAKTEIEG